MGQKYHWEKRIQELGGADYTVNISFFLFNDAMELIYFLNVAISTKNVEL